MTYYDQHVHTYFSFDSTAQFEAYLAQTAGPLITTEHLEMANPDDGGRDDTPDFAAYSAKLRALSARYPNRLLRGIEAGYYQPKLAAIRAYLAAGDYDLTLLSFHHDGAHDYLDPYFQTVDPEKHAKAYYRSMLDGLRQADFGDVLAHFDYGLRTLDVTPAQFEAWVGPQVKEILKLVVARGMALEYNTKSTGRWGNQALYDLVFPWYLALGGTRITLGSDAHVPDKYRVDFTKAQAALAGYGVTSLVTYAKHRPTNVPLEEVTVQ
ncbi:PHP domain-containing protein [Lacticaseibacillus kribbianus]|uniref:PHP domain-containing protein n=1 Tax=Lacticaseibacillus kribbianus TaxID=2926292 RepID=UPI001CD42186|nr:PHP domain-containing protein [Lacticaseibacillus kribbianus]